MLKKHVKGGAKGGAKSDGSAAADATTPAAASKPEAGGKGRFRKRMTKGASKGSGVNNAKANKKISESMKKACTMSFQKEDWKYRYIRLATSELWGVIAYRVQVAMAVASQLGKLRTSWAVLAILDYIHLFVVWTPGYDRESWPCDADCWWTERVCD